MFGLRTKILLGFGGLLLILLAVSLLGETVLDRYSRAMQRSFQEDYGSVTACQKMIESVDAIDSQFDHWCWQEIPPDKDIIGQSQQTFEDRLSVQRTSATLAGEGESTDRLDQAWLRYKSLCSELMDPTNSAERRREIYGHQLLDQSVVVHQAAENLIHMNLASMLSVHGRAHRMANSSHWAMHVLTICGAAAALGFAVFFARLILIPVRALTDSAHQIEKGNLDLTVQVHSRDELGSLATAFNQMAAQLRAYRRRDQERLMRTEQTTQLAIDSLPDAVLVLNPAGRIELANQTAKRLFGLSAGTDVQSIGKPWLEELHRRIQRTEHDASLSGYEAIIEVADDGMVRAFLPRTVPIPDNQNRPIGATIVLADVTGLRRLDEMKNGLLSMVSHELKTPLTSMRMVLHLVTEEKIGSLSGRQKELLTAARDDAERLHQIVENLLDMARIESGKALMEIQPVLPDRIVQRAAKSMEAAFKAQGVALEVQSAPDLPKVRADATRIGHVLGNLLNNALRHTPEGGTVSICTRLADGWVEFSVHDDGEGISPQYLHRVFEKFFRAPGQQGSSGSGLGLSIARDIVQAHGGQIRVESHEGRGTTFAFTLRPVDGSGLHHQKSEVGGSQEFLNVVGADDGGASAAIPADAHASAGVGH